jgi:hypothetical protein
VFNLWLNLFPKTIIGMGQIKKSRLTAWRALGIFFRLPTSQNFQDKKNDAMKLKLYFAALSVSVLLTACQHTQTSKPEAAAKTAPMTVPAAAAAPAAVAAPAAASTSAAASASADEIIIDNSDPSFKSEGDWTSATGGNDFKDDNIYASGTSASEAANTATWAPDIKTAGMYDVYEWHGDDPNSDHATNAPFTVKSDDGAKTITVNLRNNTGKWNLLGTFKFAAGKGGNVSISSSNADGNVLADAVKFVPHH